MLLTTPVLGALKEYAMSQRKSPLGKYLGTLETGTVQWVGVRPRRREPLPSVSRVQAVADLGLEGDHRMFKTSDSGRQVTLILQGFMAQIAAHLGEAHLDPARLHRNIVVSDLNLSALRRQRFWVGEALLEATQLCHSCARMGAELGPGGIIAVFEHGGLCAKVIQSGAIECGAAERLKQD